MTIIIITIPSILLLLFILYRFNLHKIRNTSYLVGSFLDSKKNTDYYILYEKKHGCFAKAKRMAKEYSLIIPKEEISLLSQKYKTEDAAELALRKFKTNFKCKK